MKFGKLYQRQIIPEWEDEYINYKKLNNLIKRSTVAFHQAHLERYEGPIQHNPDSLPIAYPLGSLSAPKLPKDDSDDDDDDDDDAEWAFSLGWFDSKEDEGSKRRKRPTTPGGMGGYGSLDMESTSLAPREKKKDKKGKDKGKKDKKKKDYRVSSLNEETPLMGNGYQAISIPDATADDEEDSILNISGDSDRTGRSSSTLSSSLSSASPHVHTHPAYPHTHTITSAGTTTSINMAAATAAVRASAGQDAEDDAGDGGKKKKKKNKQKGVDGVRFESPTQQTSSQLSSGSVPAASALRLNANAPYITDPYSTQGKNPGKTKNLGKEQSPEDQESGISYASPDTEYSQTPGSAPFYTSSVSENSEILKGDIFPEISLPESLQLSGKTNFPNSAPAPTSTPVSYPLFPPSASAVPPLPPKPSLTSPPPPGHVHPGLANPSTGSSDDSHTSNSVAAPTSTSTFSRLRHTLSLSSITSLLTPGIPADQAPSRSPLSPAQDPSAYEQHQQQFWALLKDNVARVNTHYHKILTAINVQLQKHLLPLNARSSAVQHRHTSECQAADNWRCGELREETSLPPDSAAYTEILLCYAVICQLMKYAKANANALDKILTKYLKAQPRLTLEDQPRVPVNQEYVQKFRKEVSKQDWVRALGVHDARTRVYQSGMLSRTDISAIETASPADPTSHKDVLCANVKGGWVLAACLVFAAVLALPLDLVSHHRSDMATNAQLIQASPALLQYLEVGAHTERQGQGNASSDATGNGHDDGQDEGLGASPSEPVFAANQHLNTSLVYAQSPDSSPSTVQRMPPVFPPNTPEPVLLFYNWQAQKCLAVLLLALILWCTEALPYFATALCLPPLIIVLSLVPDAQGVPLPARKAADVIASKMFSQTTFLLLMGFTLAAVACTAQLEKRIAGLLHKRLGRNPRLFVLALMFLAWILSAWLNNHTAPVLVTSIVAPILKELPQGDPFIKCVVLAVAIASNLGGMASPLASLQNIVAVQSLQAFSPISFPQWLCVCGSISFVLILVAWAIITSAVDWTAIEPLPALITQDKPFSPRQRAAVVCSAVAITLLATAGLTESYLGGITTLSLMFMGFVFATNVLPASQMHAFPWPLILLVASASALSLAIQASKLLSLLAAAALAVLSNSSMLLAAQLLAIVTILASVVSHTVAALVLLPLLAHIANDLAMPVRLVVCSALCINAAMALPFSSFPNLHSLALRDDSGNSLITAKDVIRVGTVMTVISYIVTVIVAFPILGYFVGQ